MAVYGKYEALAELGRGGMGVVYRGRALDSGAAVAIKVVSSFDLTDLDRFERERRILANFAAEDGFVPLLDSGVAGGRPYVVMPLLEGGTLSERLRRGPLGVAGAVSLVRALARALRGAHERGIIHRDLKPSNVLFDRGGRPFVADLGLAKHFRRDVPGGGKSQSITEVGASAGTLGYMAPEQLGDAKSVSPRADVFALGVILHECLAGSRPFPAENLVRYARALNGPPAPSLAKEGVPRAVDMVRAKALALEPLERYADAGAMERALGQAVTRRSLPVAVIAAAAVLLAAVGVGVSLALPPPPRPTPAVHANVAPIATRVPAATPKTDEQIDELWRSAREKLAAKDVDGAIADLDRSLALDPKRADTWVHHGVALRQRGDTAGEIADMDKAIALDPSNHEAWDNRASAHAARRETDTALSDFERAIQLAPSSAKCRFNRACLRVRLEDLTGALADLDRAIELDPKYRKALVARAEVRGRLKDRKGQIADLDRATEIDPSDATAFADRGFARREDGDVKGALDDLQRALELDPRMPKADQLKRTISELRR